MTATSNEQTTASLPESTEPAAPTLGADTPQVAPSEPRTYEFGWIDEAGMVYVRKSENECVTGVYPEGVPAEPFTLYECRLADLEAIVKLFEDRLATLSPKDISSTLETIKQVVEAPQALGDLATPRARVEAVVLRAVERKEQARAERAAAREEALGARMKVAERAEEIVAQDPEHTHWKHSGQKLRDPLEGWKNLQHKGSRLDKSIEDELWKCLSAARTQLDRHRRQYFLALDQAQSEAKRIKEALTAEVEVLQASTDWGVTSGVYRELMNRWKAMPRISRKEGDALWTCSCAAQQVFFDVRCAKDEATDLEHRENLLAKEALVDEVEKILPIENFEAAKAALRSIQDRWDEVGRAPSSDLHRTEGRLRVVETATRDAKEPEWRRSNPEARVHAQGMLSQLESQLVSLETKLEAAEERGDEKRAKSLSEAIETKRVWLTQINSSTQ